MAKRKLSLKKILCTNQGFTLIEVMIAIAIFTVFASVFVTGQGYNLLDSSKLKEEMLMKDFAENKINEIITNPPELREALTLSKETKDVESNSDYQTVVEFKNFFVPDMSKMVSANSSEDKDKEDSPEDQTEKKVYKVFKENMEKMIWQVEVTVKNKTNDSTFKLSTWLYNQNADVQIGTF
jgi:type II secretion system protein I